MFNYQSRVYAKVLETFNITDTTREHMHRGWHDLQSHIPPGLAGVVGYMGDVYIQWCEKYNETYRWIHPKGPQISNTKLHYGAGVSVGVFASLLILVFVLMKLLPSRLKTIGYLMMAMGTSATFWMFSSLSNIFGEPVTGAVVQYWQYILGYCFVMGFLSFALVYRYGPVTEERTLNLIQWFLQMIGLTLIYNSTQIQEVSVALILITLAVYNFPRAIIFNNQMSKNMWLRFFPPKIKLLTEDEYIMQGNRETKNELEKLREYCQSPNCQAWKIISKLKSPTRFAEFVQNGAWHIRNEELVQHPNGNDSDQSDNELPSDTESELVFVLGSESMRVSLQD